MRYAPATAAAALSALPGISVKTLTAASWVLFVAWLGAPAGLRWWFASGRSGTTIVLSFAFFAAFVASGALAVLKDSEDRLSTKDVRARSAALKKQAFKCVVPQIPGRVVVFPVIVDAVGGEARVVSVDVDAVHVELDARDRDALARLMSKVLLRCFERGRAKLFVLEDGPTGLAVAFDLLSAHGGSGRAAYAVPDFDLAAKVGIALQTAAKAPDGRTFEYHHLDALVDAHHLETLPPQTPWERASAERRALAREKHKAE